MSDPDDNPDWSLLPRQPRQFFGLAHGFDDQQLKRAYNRLIRRFKPERHPREFQLIRAAFEALRTRRPMPPPQAWPSPIADSRTTDEPASDALDARTELRAMPPEHVYRQLRDVPQKTPRHYQQLAILSDVVPHADDDDFAGWVLGGLVAFPDELSLARLLEVYGERAVADSKVPPLLRQIAAQAPRSVWRPTTRPLWARFARTGRGSEFCKLFDELITNSQTLTGHERALAAIEALRWVVFDADEGWLQRRWQDIQDQVGPSGLRGDQLDGLEMLLRYRQQRDAFCNGSTARQRIDNALRAISRGPSDRAERIVTAWRIETAVDPSPVLDSFPPDSVDWESAFLPLAEFVHRIDTTHAPLQTEEPRASAKELAERIILFVQSRTTRSTLGLVGIALWSAAFVLAPATMIVVAWVLASLVEHSLGTVGFAICLVALGACGAAVFDRGIRRRFYPVVDRWHTRRCYRSLWRGLIARKMIEQHVPREALLAQSQAMQPELGWFAGEFYECVQKDWGLAFVGLTQPSWDQH